MIAIFFALFCPVLLGIACSWTERKYGLEAAMLVAMAGALLSALIVQWAVRL